MRSPQFIIRQVLLALVLTPAALAYGPGHLDQPPAQGAYGCQLPVGAMAAATRTGLSFDAIAPVGSALAPGGRMVADAGTATNTATDAAALQYHILSKLPEHHRLHLQFHRLCLNPLVVSTHPGPYNIRVDPGWAWVSPDKRLSLGHASLSERQPDVAVLAPEVESEGRTTFSRMGLAASRFEYAGEDHSWHTALLDHYFAISDKNIRASGYPADFLNLIVITVEDQRGKRVFRSALFIDNYFSGAPIPFPKIPVGAMKRRLLLKADGFPKRPGPNHPVFFENDPERNCRGREGLLLSFGLLPQ